MDSKSICEQKDIDEKIKQFEEIQKELECLVKSLEQMHQDAVNTLNTIKNWGKKNEK